MLAGASADAFPTGAAGLQRWDGAGPGPLSDRLSPGPSPGHSTGFRTFRS